jgi:hypothetical protein
VHRYSCTEVGFVSLANHINCVYGVVIIVYWSERGPQCFSQKLDSGDSGEDLKKVKIEHYLHVEKVRDYSQSYLIKILVLA